MNTDILNSIMKISNDKKDTLMYFLSPDIQDTIRPFELVNKNKLYLNDKIYCISKSNLQLEYSGLIKHMDEKILIKKNRLPIYIDPKNYYIFVQPSQNTKSDRLFFESLLKNL